MLSFPRFKNILFALALCAILAPAAIACTESTAYKRLYTVFQNAKVGYIDEKGKLLIKPAYKRATYFREGFAIVSFDDDKRFYINETGRKLNAPVFEEAWLFNDGLAGVKIGDKWGYIDRKGKLVIPAKFDSADSFCGGRAVVGIKNGDTFKFGFIDKTGKFVVEPTHHYISGFTDGVAQFSNDIKFTRKPTYFLQDGPATFGLMDANGKVIVEPRYSSIFTFYDGLAQATYQEKWGFIDKAGNWQENFGGHITRNFSEGLAGAFTPEDGYGFLNKKGEFVIEPQYTEVKEFSGGLAPVKKDKTWGFIDKTGKMVIPAKFVTAESFEGPLAQVTIDGTKIDPVYNSPERLFGYIDKSGKYIWAPSR